LVTITVVCNAQNQTTEKLPTKLLTKAPEFSPHREEDYER